MIHRLSCVHVSIIRDVTFQTPPATMTGGGDGQING
jgi:hypothetical protein